MVQRLVNGIAAGPFCALKDVWAHDDCTQEHNIIPETRKAQPDYAQHLLTPVDYGYVPYDLATALGPDNTHKTLRRQKLEPTRKVLHAQSLPMIRPTSKSQTSNLKSVPRNSIGSPEDFLNLPWRVAGPSKTYLSNDSRQHYRMVVKEIGEPVYSLRNFTDIFTTIQGGWKGLRAIHRGNLVYRDVSGGNILLMPASETLERRGVIMDLEYAKDIDDIRAPCDMRTGTVAFMPTEVTYMKHHTLANLRSFLRMNNPPSEDLGRKRAKVAPLPPFRHNPLHDMESMWWLCIWMMLRLVPSNVSGKQYFRNYWMVFFDPLIKDEFFRHATKFLEYTARISIKPFTEIMNEWRDQLDILYFNSCKAQNALPGPLERIQIDDTTLQLAYDFGSENLKSLKAASMEVTTNFVTMTERHHQVPYDCASQTF
ncbi:kinase domain protein [Rhizoctonia solani 123E]|uniref:Kinase domain protein n=1 Tax=Rhizoctonia solani 123E TaxID=1423351 RepID=A0A074RDS8_9AGAM|nr:kinase domain protein [Rhizoctonia solani 123E]